MSQNLLTEPLTGFLKLSFFSADGGSDSPASEAAARCTLARGIPMGAGAAAGAFGDAANMVVINRTLCGD
jgi:hypothetical protein